MLRLNNRGQTTVFIDHSYRKVISAVLNTRERCNALSRMVKSYLTD
jgi:hypothetical protein